MEVPRPLSWIPEKLQDHEQRYLSYYQADISRRLGNLDSNNNEFRNLIIKMAMHDSSSASKAILQSIYALSAFCLYGSKYAMPHKLEAIHAIKTSVAGASTKEDILRNLVASMFLAIYEVQLTPQDEKLDLQIKRSLDIR